MKKSYVLLIAAGVLAGVISIVSVFSHAFFGPFSGGAAGAVIYLNGTIGVNDSSYNHEWLKNTLSSVTQSGRNRAVILVLNSPGGSIYEVDEIYGCLLEYKNTGRPLIVSMGPIAASGGYYLAAPADKIFASRNTLTGSIGVTMGSLIDLTGFLEKNGVRVKNITSGKNKAMGSLLEHFTDEQVDIMESISADAYEQFVSIVADGRGMTEAKVRALADGRIYTARQALAADLIDGLGSLDDAKAAAELQARRPLLWRDYTYHKKPSLMERFLGDVTAQIPDGPDGLVRAIAECVRMPQYLVQIER